MKTILLLMLAVPVMAQCPTGFSEYAGNCVSEQGPAESTVNYKPSTEMPPKDKMPSYEREGVHADTPASLIYQDSKQDQDRKDADQSGKSAAGL